MLMLLNCRFQDRVINLLTMEIGAVIQNESRNGRVIRVKHSLGTLRVQCLMRRLTDSGHDITGQQQICAARINVTRAHFISVMRQTNVRQNLTTLLCQTRLIQNTAMLVFQMRSHTQQRPDGQNARTADTRHHNVIGIMRYLAHLDVRDICKDIIHILGLCLLRLAAQNCHE